MKGIMILNSNDNISCTKQTLVVTIITATITGGFGYLTALKTSEYEYKKTIDKLQIELNATNMQNFELHNYKIEDKNNQSISKIKSGILQIQLLANGFDAIDVNRSSMQQAGEIFSETSIAMSQANMPLNICNDFSDYQVSFNNLITSIDQYNKAQYYNDQVETKNQLAQYAFHYRNVSKLSTILLYQIDEYTKKERK